MSDDTPKRSCGDLLTSKGGDSLPCHRPAGHVGDHQAGQLLASYRCPHCGAVSSKPNDLWRRWCRQCHRFEEAP